MAGIPDNDPAVALAGMARIGSPREPMGDSAYEVYGGASYQPSPNTTLVQKQGDQGGDLSGPAGNRAYGAYPLPAGSGDRNGAVYRVGVSFPQATIPQAGMTQANGRMVRHAVQRNLPNFGDGIEASYL